MGAGFDVIFIGFECCRRPNAILGTLRSFFSADDFYNEGAQKTPSPGHTHRPTSTIETRAGYLSQILSRRTLWEELRLNER
jgi:hypothetical protein